ncbi:MAG TPA: thymidine phosphorylase [candidate division WOR-3 bacterium]|uniref:Thymidine phosphorylase n=1 Tax=candidate division WOR-3 bacterium TaxID=2052148 RepID=A0A7V0T4T7_UNCW3|nr:thymidine phosphorylase [candidate division WOR-3 bacterium]
MLRRVNPYELILRKRNRGRLAPEEIRALVEGFGSGAVPDYQMSAFLMAVYFRGMNVEETVALTEALMNSGERFEFPDLAGPKVDKHSTGGVGDKVSLILAPLAAACGLIVPMVSGRSLGHTGGTLDKLESISGFRTDLSRAEFERILGNIGVSMMGQTDGLCPADRRMYALRDVTATVDSIPLIAASIMSKKLAEGIDGLVLDVKTGGGAFMSRLPQARSLARQMLRIGARMGKRVVAVITGMSEPLGHAVGNALEVAEAIEALKGRWPLDLEEVTLALGEEMLLLGRVARTQVQARRLLLRALADGRALEVFRKLVEAQGGDPKVIDDPSRLPRAGHVHEVFAPAGGYLRQIDALRIGLLGVELGAGRRKLGAKVDPAVGFVFRRKVGDKVEPGELLFEVHAATRRRAEEAGRAAFAACTIGRNAPRAGERVIARMGR